MHLSTILLISLSTFISSQSVIPCTSWDCDCSVLNAWIPAIPAQNCQSINGVTISGRGRISTLIMVPSQVFRSPTQVPETLAKLDGLTVLYINQGNELIIGPIPDSLTTLPSIQILDLAHNDHTGPIPSFKQNSMTYLDLGYNRLSGSIPESLTSMTSLQQVWLSSNLLTGNVPDFSNLNSLTHLWIHTNQLTGNINQVIGTFGKLKHFNINTNNLSGELTAFPEGSFERCLFLDAGAKENVCISKTLVIPTVCVKNLPSCRPKTSVDPPATTTTDTTSATSGTETVMQTSNPGAQAATATLTASTTTEPENVTPFILEAVKSGVSKNSFGTMAIGFAVLVAMLAY